MAATYLTAITAQKKLILSGKYLEDNAPTVEQLENILIEIEIRLDEWLGYRAAITDYEETYKATNHGTVLLANHPVIDVSKLLIQRSILGEPDYDVPIDLLKSIWRHGRTIDIGFDCNINYRSQFGLTYPALYPLLGDAPVVKVFYTAGLDPTPPIFASVVYATLLKAIAATGLSGDLSFLDEPTRDTASLSLPGGLSKSFKIGGGAKSEVPLGETVLDRLFAPLARYRRLFLT